MIVCGWCHAATSDLAWCAVCSHPDPRLPWEQRALPVPPADPYADQHKRLAEATTALGGRATAESLAEYLDVSPRTVRRWQQKAAP